MSGVRVVDQPNRVTVTDDGAVVRIAPIVTVLDQASQIGFTPADPLSGTDVQAALAELAAAVAPRIPTVKSSIYIEDNATATVVSQNVATKVAGTFLAGPACQSCTYDGNRITYIGTRPTRVMAVATIDVNSSANNQIFRLEIRKNGQIVDGARVRIRFATFIVSGSIAAMIDLDENDYVELWITNATSGNDPTVRNATFALMN